MFVKQDVIDVIDFLQTRGAFEIQTPLAGFDQVHVGNLGLAAGDIPEDWQNNSFVPFLLRVFSES